MLLKMQFHPVTCYLSCPWDQILSSALCSPIFSVTDEISHQFKEPAKIKEQRKLEIRLSLGRNSNLSHTH
jgi:hypothetical protein